MPQNKDTAGLDKMILDDDGDLFLEAKALVQKAYSKVLSLEEDVVKDETDFFEAGGSE